MKKTLLTSNKARGFQVSRGHNPRGSFLVESTISLFLLVAISVVLVTSSMNILRPRNWTMKQNLVDAYLTQEVALANRVDFNAISAGTSSWGTGDAANYNPSVANGVVVGLLPSFTAGGAGRPYTATVHRVRRPHQSNAAIANFTPSGAGGTIELGDLGIQCYELQTHVEYVLGGSTYVKSRTVIRSQ